MIRHVVLWRMKDESRDQAPEMVRRLQALDTLPMVESLSVGADALGDPAAWDVCLIADFATADDLEAYRVHDDHQAVAMFIREVAHARAVVDFQV